MCESSVWLQYPDGRTEKIADNVLIVKQEGPEVVLSWFLAEPRRVVGAIREVDAIKHVITLDVPGTPRDFDEQTETSKSSPDTGFVHPDTHHHFHTHHEG